MASRNWASASCVSAPLGSGSGARLWQQHSERTALACHVGRILHLATSLGSCMFLYSGGGTSKQPTMLKKKGSSISAYFQLASNWSLSPRSFTCHVLYVPGRVVSCSLGVLSQALGRSGEWLGVAAGRVVSWSFGVLSEVLGTSSIGIGLADAALRLAILLVLAPGLRCRTSSSVSRTLSSMHTSSMLANRATASGVLTLLFLGGRSFLCSGK